MPSDAALEKKMEVSRSFTLGAERVAPVAATCGVLVRLKGPSRVRTKAAVKEYVVT